MFEKIQSLLFRLLEIKLTFLAGAHSKIKHGEVRTSLAHIFYWYTSVIVWWANLNFYQKRESKQK